MAGKATITLPVDLVNRMASILGNLPHNQVWQVLAEVSQYPVNPLPDEKIEKEAQQRYGVKSVPFQFRG